ncbi:phosphoribosylformylglycinamidine synthase subunit PurL [Venenivibrio stagnispumantis]|uniref:Phosphoribosylformylglycinamidine synthase subunit PurL n=1 Tax=Venenivibrio stagnispumantis TaxID=407998 RepID=A0AA46AEL4_9AQUI|nr:phosphoribosylformylglycinamidine synthase subunit PurL [Venenivibrio stagnispumantis]MCW4572829.1 phosphoribosylformylglycinamidine synthase subunit PurL [Venenivibrio stagnispumantis]SMP13520.1 phosphoribosylformylglycinamidine synthase [Venenivibrio stagnispumantis]
MEEKLLSAHGLNIQEYKRIIELIGREPNEVELGVFGALWSEHCSYKSSKPFLKVFPTKAPWVLQGPGENAGVVEIDENVAVVFKVESHNHPSYIEPFHGAATGVGGIIRDILSMGARPIALADSLRFGDLRNDGKRKGIKDTKPILKRVVEGIGFYGNCIGVPTVAGETVFDEVYAGNPLVNAFCLGILKKDKIYRARATKIGQKLVMVGSSTGRDGIHGATMASAEFSAETESKRPNVQIGDPFFGKRLIEATLEVMEKNLIAGCQDFGAAGLAGSTSEFGAKSKMGVNVYLENVPLREEGMTPYEILLSESQERMLYAVDEENVEEVIKIAKKHGLEAAVIGETTEGNRLKVYYKDQIVVDLPISAIVDDAPVYDRPRKEPSYLKKVKSFNQDELPKVDLKEAITKIISSLNIADKSWVYSQYDHEVGTNTVVKPGSDAAIIRLKWPARPELYSEKAIAISSDGNGKWVYLDPYEGGKRVVTESIRNLYVSGAKPLAITDCINWGNPENPEILWQLEQATKGMAKACEELNTPVIGGNVSLYNETVLEDKRINIYPTPVVVAVGVLDKPEYAIPSFYQSEGNYIAIVGEIDKKPNIAGSEFLKEIHGKVAGDIGETNLTVEKKLLSFILSNREYIKSAHDVSDGGLITALLEPAFEKDLGIDITINTPYREDFELFDELRSIIVISISEKDISKLEEEAKKNEIGFRIIGKITDDKKFKLKINDIQIEEDIRKLKQLWKEGFKKYVI